MAGDTLKIWNEGAKILVRSDARHITTYGRTLREALLNFSEAYSLNLAEGAPVPRRPARTDDRYGRPSARPVRSAAH